jgi:hypothetical protein
LFGEGDNGVSNLDEVFVKVLCVESEGGGQIGNCKKTIKISFLLELVYFCIPTFSILMLTINIVNSFLLSKSQAYECEDSEDNDLDLKCQMQSNESSTNEAVFKVNGMDDDG